MTRAPAAVLFLMLAVPETAKGADPLDAVSVAVPRAKGSTKYGTKAMMNALRIELGKSVDVVPTEALPRSSDRDGLVMSCTRMGVRFVLQVEVAKEAREYFARATLIDLEAAHPETQFIQYYSSPKRDAADRGVKLARKARTLIWMAVKTQKESPESKPDLPITDFAKTDPLPKVAETERRVVVVPQQPGPVEEPTVKVETSDADRARDAELFADSNVIEEPKPPVGGAKDIKSASDVESDTQISKMLGEVKNRFTVGAFLYLRFEYSAVGNDRPAQNVLKNSDLVDLYLDAKPIEGLRGYVSGRLLYNPSLTDDASAPPNSPIEKTRVLLDQIWVRFNAADTVFFTLGQQHIRWGSSRFWNPTDFLNDTAINPFAAFDTRTGVNLLKVHLPIESLGWNLYAIASYDQVNKPKDLGAALRAELVFGQNELALSAAVKQNHPLRFGADLSSGLGPFDLRIEAALTGKLKQSFWAGDFDAENGIIPTELDRSAQWLPQLVAGADVSIPYSDEDSALLGVEYFYNGLGYDDSTLYPWLILQQPSALTPLYAGKHYGAVYIVLAKPGSLENSTFTLTGIGNISDRSALIRLEYELKALEFLKLNAFGQGHLGSVGREFRFGVDLPASPIYPQLPNGFSVTAPMFEVGMSLSMDF